MIFLWGAIGAVAYSDLLPFWMLIVGGVLISITIIGMNLFASSNKPGTTTTTDISGSDNGGSSDDTTPAPSATTPSPANWGGIIAGVVTVAILIGALFFWAPWEKEGDTQGWQKTTAVVQYKAIVDSKEVKVLGIYFPGTLPVGSKVVFKKFRWKMSFKGEEGNLIPDYISPGSESTIKINSVHCALLVPVDGQSSKEVVMWWRPL